jgi:hypothetical protein
MKIPWKEANEGPPVNSNERNKQLRGEGNRGTTKVFVGGTCGSIHAESFNKNMLETQW